MPATHKQLMMVLEENRKAADQCTAVGAVLVFKSSGDRRRCQEYLDRLAERGIIEPTTAVKFNPDIGGPVFYIP